MMVRAGIFFLIRIWFSLAHRSIRVRGLAQSPADMFYNRAVDWAIKWVVGKRFIDYYFGRRDAWT